jgi:uncharacterized glyoxalase superfamily protein PhnB
MPAQPPLGSPQISSYLAYEDPRAAIRWLQKAFGFKLRVLVEDGAGGIAHCELEYGSGVIGIGAGSPLGKSPRALGGAYTQSLYVFVDDIDAHFTQAKAAGARITRELENKHYGDRTYGCEDLEGHPWYFGHRYDQEAWDRSISGAHTPA